METKPDPGAEPIVDTTTPPTVEKNPDGSSVITQPTVTPGKETTTTTGTGEATGNLHEKKEEVPKADINLKRKSWARSRTSAGILRRALTRSTATR